MVFSPLLVPSWAHKGKQQFLGHPVSIIFELGIQYKLGNESFMNISHNVKIEGKGLNDKLTRTIEYDVNGQDIILEESKSQTFSTF